MDRSVLIPWRPTEDRRQPYEYVAEWWRTRGWRVVTGDSDDEWSRSPALNRAHAQTSDQILCICDADVYPDPAVLDAALALLAETGRPTYVGDQQHHLNRDAANRVYQGETPSEEGCMWHWQAHTPLVLHAESWVPFDELFVGWGEEDVAHAISLWTLHSDQRVPGDAWHLWHSQVGPGPNPHYQANYDRAQRYRAAEGNRDAIQRLLDEGSTARPSPD